MDLTHLTLIVPLECIRIRVGYFFDVFSCQILSEVALGATIFPFLVDNLFMLSITQHP